MLIQETENTKDQIFSNSVIDQVVQFIARSFKKLPFSKLISVRKVPFPGRKEILVTPGRKRLPKKLKKVKPFKASFPKLRQQRVSKGNFKLTP